MVISRAASFADDQHHLTELRRGLDQSCSALHLLPVQYAEPSPVQFVTVVRQQQVNEIRGGVR
jgi:hypothetical protein